MTGSVAAVAFTASLLGQSSTEPRVPLAFDVVSVKPNTSGETGGTSRAQPGRYQGLNVTLFRVITLASPGMAPPFVLRFSVAPCRSVFSVTSDSACLRDAVFFVSFVLFVHFVVKLAVDEKLNRVGEQPLD